MVNTPLRRSPTFYRSLALTVAPALAMLIAGCSSTPLGNDDDGGGGSDGSNPRGKVCGGLAGVGCAPGFYCQFPASSHCGAADQTGLCTAIPQVCTQEYAPVCGCDGKTYGNACSAAGAGVSVMSQGACAPTGTACGARAGNTCTANEYCAYVDGQLCGQADAEAVCQPRPMVCDTIYAPVCGCDGQTYASSCTAAAAGSGVMHTGPCAGAGRSCVVGGVTYPDGSGNIPAGDGCNTCGCTDGTLACTKKACPISKTCGGFAGLTCTATEYCAYVEGQLCGAADASSTCQPRPGGCLTNVDPVCACDGKTYSNACVAAMAGFGISNKGACK